MRPTYRYIMGIMFSATLLMPGGQPPARAHHYSALAGHATHGLRAYLDPDTGEYARQPELAPQNQLQALFSAGAIAAPAAAKPLIEVGSAKAGGGFTIDLQERFRPTRRKPDV